MTKRFGFRLAEVLITLGIIGVVAAMTMPTLMNSTQGAQYKAAYKKALSALSQAVTLNVALDEWSFADLDTAADSGYTLENLLSNRMNVVRTEKSTFKGADGKAYTVTTPTGAVGVATPAPTAPTADNTTLFFNDGIMFTYKTSAAKNCTKADGATANPCYGFIDVNGIKAPNRQVKCDEGTGADNSNCVIKNPTDIYPVVFYDQTVLPSSVAARAVLYSK